MSLDTYRLTDDDEDRMRAALRHAYVDLWRRPRVDATTADALERIACHAIGCGVVDLRDVELEWIRNEIGELELEL